MRTRIKICGITRADDAALACDLGADALGLVFYPRSPRCVSVAQALEVLGAKVPFVTAVGLFLDPAPDHVLEILRQVPLDLLQFHGDERGADCERFGRPYIKAVPMGGQNDVQAYAASHPQARALLLDSHRVGQAGGTGAAFDWSRWPEGLDSPLILAGGLHPGNVAEAIAQVRPCAVDVSSGVESGQGVKDPDRLAEFFEEVHRVDCERY
jgi:phosphoribosylanthranilate isomerase